MNLITDPWLPYLLADGTEQTMPMAAALSNPEVVNFALPRADFQGAAYQFAIGLLQTVFAPSDDRQWLKRYDDTTSEEELSAAFAKVEHAFDMVGEGPLFMQDFDDLTSAKPTNVSSLLIEAPGGNTLKLNTDHFVKRGIGECLSLEMAALALFTLQINAPSGGQGHRVGLRGGGPLTTLVMPQNAEASLWRKLWLNVVKAGDIWNEQPDLNSRDVFPWLGPTRESAKKGTEVYAGDVHPLHMYWAMPRRIRLNVEDAPGTCELSGKPCKLSVTSYRTVNYGYNYSGSWRHPLTPYRWNPKKSDEDHLSVKGQQGGITYKTWDTLTFSSNEQGQVTAKIVEHFYAIADRTCGEHGEIPRLWVFGYDMDNMKARGWYSVEMPLFNVSQGRQDQLLVEVKTLQELANQTLRESRNQIKTAWFSRPSDAKGDMSYIDLSFWQRTEASFFNAVSALIHGAPNQHWLTAEHAEAFLKNLAAAALNLFDELVLADAIVDRSMADRIVARRALKDWLTYSKLVKDFKTSHQIETTREAV
jgi:CRISPR system Cascade subunit CasA